MEDDFIKHDVHTVDLHINVMYEYNLPIDFIIDEVVSAINSKIKSTKVKEISVIQTKMRRVYS